MPMVADVVDAVVGGDSHRDTHSLEMVTPAGVTLADITVANTEDGYAQALGWIAAHAPGERVLLTLEGTRSYGIGLARAAQAAGWTVTEPEPPVHRGRRGKTDPIDAHTAALATLRQHADQLAAPRADGDREALRILLGARQELASTKTTATNRLRALLLSGTERQRELARARLTHTVLTELATSHATETATREHHTRQAEIRRLAHTITQLHHQLATNHRELATIVTEFAPTLLNKHGVGPVTAAHTITAWSHPGRCRNEAAFAALAGTNPLPANSGRTTRHRLNRGGDRDLNRAIHTIMLTRWRSCPHTHNYIAKRHNQGTSNNDIQRLLKRYIARELFRTLNTTTPT